MNLLELQNLTLMREPPEKRLPKAEGGIEQHMSGTAVILAFAMHLFSHGTDKVSVRLDGEHGKRFEIQAWTRLIIHSAEETNRRFPVRSGLFQA